MKFDLVFEEVMGQVVEKEIKSFDDFKQFCKTIGLFVQLNDTTADSKYISCILYFDPEFKMPLNYFNKFHPLYYNEYREVFDKLQNFKDTYWVTKDGTKNSKQIIWF